MNDLDKSDFAEAVTEVLKSYNQQTGKITLRMWWAGLERFDIKKVINALGAYVADPERCRFAPKAGDIVAMIEGSHADHVNAGEVAFMRAYEAIGSAGRYASVCFDDAAIHHAIEMSGGWEAFCTMTESEKPFRRKDFVSAYASYSGGAYIPRLAGMEERQNSAGGYRGSFAIEYVGDREKAIAVECGGRQGGMEASSVGMFKPKAIAA